MSNFIKKDDYDASIRREILDSVTREDEATICICEDRAIEEMKSYLSGRYDIGAIFSASGRNRHKLIVMFCIDITIYHLFCTTNPQKLSKMRKDRYDRAVDWLERVQSGKISPNGLPAASSEVKAAASPYLMKSNPKRTNHR